MNEIPLIKHAIQDRQTIINGQTLFDEGFNEWLLDEFSQWQIADLIMISVLQKR